MMKIKKAKEKKILYNNPPKKESYLKGSKDLNGDPLDYKFAKDVFGAQKDPVQGRNDNQRLIFQ